LATAHARPSVLSSATGPRRSCARMHTCCRAPTSKQPNASRRSLAAR